MFDRFIQRPWLRQIRQAKVQQHKSVVGMILQIEQQQLEVSLAAARFALGRSISITMVDNDWSAQQLQTGMLHRRNDLLVHAINEPQVVAAWEKTALRAGFHALAV